MFSSVKNKKPEQFNIGILFSDFGPYHVARIEALANEVKNRKGRLFAFRFAETSETYKWKPETPVNADVITLSHQQPAGLIKACKIAFTFFRQLKKNKIAIVFLPSYSPLPNLLCFMAAKIRGCKTILMIDSWHATEKAGFFGRCLKHLLIRLYDAALVAGTPHIEYVRTYGQESSKIFTGYDVVDINYFMNKSRHWKNTPLPELPVKGLPGRFFLNLGRFVPKKNLGLLVQAYGKLVKRHPATNIALVLVGEGSEEKKLKQTAAGLGLSIRDGMDDNIPAMNLPEVVFYPFQQTDLTPLFFSRCEAFVLPSLYEEWGLVVNEAMATGAAVIVSENAGCSRDLVTDGQNGFLFNPVSVDELESILEKFIEEPALSGELGKQGMIDIQEWGPQRFADGSMQAINSVTRKFIGSNKLEFHLQ
jgi:1,2-diacylglycerol 3-alpha-glucosyltransferase